MINNLKVGKHFITNDGGIVVLAKIEEMVVNHLNRTYPFFRYTWRVVEKTGYRHVGDEYVTGWHGMIDALLPRCDDVIVFD